MKERMKERTKERKIQLEIDRYSRSEKSFFFFFFTLACLAFFCFIHCSFISFHFFCCYFVERMKERKIQLEIARYSRSEKSFVFFFFSTLACFFVSFIVLSFLFISFVVILFSFNVKEDESVTERLCGFLENQVSFFYL